MVRILHSHDRLREIARDLGFDAAGLLRTHAQANPILNIGFGRLCQAMSNHLGHVRLPSILLCLLCFYT